MAVGEQSEVAALVAPIEQNQIELFDRVECHIGQTVVAAGRLVERSKNFLRILPDKSVAAGTLGTHMLSVDTRQGDVHFLPHPQAQLPGTELYDQTASLVAQMCPNSTRIVHVLSALNALHQESPLL